MIMNNSSYSLLSKYSIVCCQMVEKINEGKKIFFFLHFKMKEKKVFFGTLQQRHKKTNLSEICRDWKFLTNKSSSEIFSLNESHWDE